MIPLYFTFGTDERYPYGIHDYVIVIGKDTHDCIETFRKKHPDRPGSDAYNAADSYTKEQWNEIKDQYYNGVKPVEILVSDTVYGEKPASYEPIWFFVPKMSRLICIQDGSDSKIWCTSYHLGYNIAKDTETWLPVTDVMAQYYDCLADMIPDVLGTLYDDMFMEVQILRGEAF